MSIPKTSAGSGNIYLGSNLIAESGCGKWKPSQHTLLYYDFDGDLTDKSGNGRDQSMTSGHSFSYGTTSSGGKYVSMSRGNWSNVMNIPYNYDDLTVSFLFYPTEIVNSRISFDMHTGSGMFARASTYSGYVAPTVDGYPQTETTANKRYYFTVVNKNKTVSIYKNGIFWASGTSNYNVSTAKFRLNGDPERPGSFSSNNKLALLIVEDYGWDSNYIKKYYDNISGLYS